MRNARLLRIFLVLCGLATLLGVTEQHTATYAASPGAPSGATVATPTGRQTIPQNVCSITRNGSITNSDPSADYYANANRSVCGSTPTCSLGGIAGNPLHYDIQSFTNPAPFAQCVDVQATASGCMDAVAYLGSFNPANRCQNFLGHVGPGAINGTRYFSFTVPAGANFDVVLTEWTINTGCANYTVSVTGEFCAPYNSPTPPPTASRTPTNTPTATATHTNTPIPPTATRTPTPTNTNTPMPPTATDTPAPTDTSTPIPPTATGTPPPPSYTIFLSVMFYNAVEPAGVPAPPGAGRR
jgi:hypothetical protein